MQKPHPYRFNPIFYPHNDLQENLLTLFSYEIVNEPSLYITFKLEDGKIQFFLVKRNEKMNSNSFFVSRITFQ